MVIRIGADAREAAITAVIRALKSHESVAVNVMSDYSPRLAHAGRLHRVLTLDPILQLECHYIQPRATVK